MLLTVFSNYLILLCIFGYSFVLKKFLFKRELKLKIYNIDFFYGFLFLIFLSLLLNFILPLKYFTIPVILFGTILFLFGFNKKSYEINFLYYFIIIFFITFIAFYGGNNVDSPMYHLQIIKWLSLHKINFGIVNLGIRLGFNSSWHSFIALTNIIYDTFNAKYYVSAVIFSITLYEAIKYKSKINLSYIFLYLFFCYLFLFSYLHPQNYGVILSHISNPERDIVSMFLYFFSFYLFIKIFEEREYTNKKVNLINLLVISTFICVTTRLTTILILSLPLYVFYKNYQYKILNNFSNIFIIVFAFFWMVRSFILSGCFIFPVEQTCFNTSWSVNIEVLQHMVGEAKRFTRTLPFLNGVNDYNYSLYTYDWLKPWIKDYLFTTAQLQINMLIIFGLLLLTLLKLFFIKSVNLTSFKIDQHETIIIIVLFFSIILWMVTPEVRFAWGLHFVIPCFFITLFIKKNLNKMIERFSQKLFLINFFIIFLLFLSKNIFVFKADDLFSIPHRKHDFSKIQKVGTFNDFDIFFNNWKCADYEGICVNNPKKHYNIETKYTYTFFKKD